MSNPETAPEKRQSTVTFEKYSFGTLQKTPPLYASFLQMYCDIFNAPPWNENWAQAGVDQVLNAALGPSGKVALAIKDESIVGFCAIREGPADQLVAVSVNAYLKPLFPENTRQRIIGEVLKKIKEGNYPSDIILGCELAVVPQKRNTSVAFRLLKTLVADELESPGTRYMYGTTSKDSPLFKIFSKGYRRAAILLDLNDIAPDPENRVFLIKDMREFFRH